MYGSRPESLAECSKQEEGSLVFSIKWPYLLSKTKKNGSVGFRPFLCKLAAPFPVMSNEYKSGGTA